MAASGDWKNYFSFQSGSSQPASLMNSCAKIWLSSHLGFAVRIYQGAAFAVYRKKHVPSGAYVIVIILSQGDAFSFIFRI